jgi:hypothetical protein
MKDAQNMAAQLPFEGERKARRERLGQEPVTDPSQGEQQRNPMPSLALPRLPLTAALQARLLLEKLKLPPRRRHGLDGPVPEHESSHSATFPLRS